MKDESTVQGKDEMHRIQYHFTEAEIKEKAIRLAAEIQERSKLEDELADIKAQYKSKIEAKNSEINLLSSQVNSGFEMKEVRCQVMKDFDKGTKDYIYDGKVYATVRMTDRDYQTEMPA